MVFTCSSLGLHQQNFGPIRSDNTCITELQLLMTGYIGRGHRKTTWGGPGSQAFVKTQAQSLGTDWQFLEAVLSLYLLNM